MRQGKRSQGDAPQTTGRGRHEGIGLCHSRSVKSSKQIMLRKDEPGGNPAPVESGTRLQYDERVEIQQRNRLSAIRLNQNSKLKKFEWGERCRRVGQSRVASGWP